MDPRAMGWAIYLTFFIAILAMASSIAQWIEIAENYKRMNVQRKRIDYLEGILGMSEMEEDDES